MCNNNIDEMRLDDENSIKENGNTTFGDSLWNCLTNPREARAVFRRRIDDNKQLLPCGFKGPSAPKTKISLGLDIRPIKSKRSSLKELQISKKPRLDTTATVYDQTISLNDFIPPVASTPAPTALPASKIIQDLNVTSTSKRESSSRKNSNSPKNSLNSIVEVAEEVVPKSPAVVAPVDVPPSPSRTPKRKSLAVQAILRNAEQYSPKKTPQKVNDINRESLKTPPRSLQELDER